MSFIITPLRWVVDLLYSWVGSYGVAIILFTLAVKLVLLPLDIKQRHSMRKMQDIQPKIEEINKKYEKDPEKRSAKTMELYKKEKVNPMGGCLPMLIQLPILYAMFAVMRHIAGEQAVLMVQQVTQGLPFEPESFLWIRNIWQPDNIMANVIPTLSEISVNRSAASASGSRSISPPPISPSMKNRPSATRKMRLRWLTRPSASASATSRDSASGRPAVDTVSSTL